MPAEHRWPWAA